MKGKTKNESEERELFDPYDVDADLRQYTGHGFVLERERPSDRRSPKKCR